MSKKETEKERKSFACISGTNENQIIMARVLSVSLEYQARFELSNLMLCHLVDFLKHIISNFTIIRLLVFLIVKSTLSFNASKVSISKRSNSGLKVYTVTKKVLGFVLF